MTGDDGVEHLSGTVVGQFTLKEVIGRGGMGVVYSGSRTDGKLAQQVAIKFLYPSIMHLIGENLVHNEAYILSKLNHQNITHVLDAGTSADGHHYFAMEYVDGIAIDVYCQQNKLTIKQRLKLFLNVCDAISKAHLLNIAHTDIKPGNILVNKEGVVKVLDFGIAKLIHGDSTSQHQKMVQRYLRALSINYASPEQLKNDKLTLQTDQYSLAILLHQLLTERTPFSRDKHAINEIIEQVVKGQVPSLTSQVSSLKAKWQLTGDINHIVKKALSPSPEQRYKTLTDFSSDLYRYLKKRPISIKSNSRIYNAQKWLARSPAQAFVLLISLSASVLFWQQNIQIEREKNNALEVANQLSAMFESTDPSHGGNSDLKAIDILTKGEQTIKASQTISDEVKYHLLTVLAKSYSGIGYNQQAESLLEEVLRNKDKLTPKQYEQVLLTLARSLRGQRKNKRAEVVFNQLLAHDEKYPISIQDRLSTYLKLADLGYNNYSGSELYEKYRNKAKALTGQLTSNDKARLVLYDVEDESRKLWEQYNGDGVKSIHFEKYKEGIKVLILRLEQALPLTGSDYELKLEIISELSSLYYETEGSNSSAAKDLITGQLDNIISRLGENNIISANWYHKLATKSFDDKNFIESEKFNHKALALYKKIETRQSFNYFKAVLLSARTKYTYGQLDASENIYHKAKQTYDKIAPEKITIPLKVGYYNELRQYIFMLFAMDRQKEAKSYVKEALYLAKHDVQLQIVNAGDINFLVKEMQALDIGLTHNWSKAITYWENTYPKEINNLQIEKIWFYSSLLSYNNQNKEALKYWEKILPNATNYFLTTLGFYSDDVWAYQQCLLANNKSEEAKLLNIKVIKFFAEISIKDNYWLEKAKKKLDVLKKNHPDLFS
jgi:serine/threonine protein kinase